MRCEGKASRPLQALRQWIWLAAVTLIVSLGALSAAAAFGTLSPDVNEALQRFTGGHNYASQAEKAKDQGDALCATTTPSTPRASITKYPIWHIKPRKPTSTS